MHATLISLECLPDPMVFVRADFILEEPGKGVAEVDQVFSNSNPLLSAAPRLLSQLIIVIG